MNALLKAAAITGGLGLTIAALAGCASSYTPPADEGTSDPNDPLDD